MELAGQQQAAARRRLRLLLLALGRPRQGEPEHRGAPAHHRAVRGGLRGQRRHSQPDVPLADDRPVQRRPQQEHHHDVARRRVVRHRPPEPEGRLHRQPARRHPLGQPRRNDLRYRVNNGVAEPVHHLHPQPAERSLDAQPRALRAGPVDAGQAHALGRAALRPRVELGAGAAAREPVLRRAAVVGPDAGGGQLQRHHAALLGRLRPVRQRQDGDQGHARASTSSPPSPRRTTRSATRRRASPPTRPAPGPTATATGCPDCDYRNPRDSGQHRRAAATSAAWPGTATSARRTTTTPSTRRSCTGWGVRPSDWSWGVSVQQEVLPRVSVEVGFFHREFFGFTVTDNLAVAPENLRQVLDHGAGGFAAAGRRRLRGRSDLRPQHAVARRRDAQLHHLLGHLRRPVPEIQRHRRQRQRAAAQRPHRPGRLQRRQGASATTARSGTRCRRSRWSAASGTRSATSRRRCCRSTRRSPATSSRRWTCR